MFTKEYLKKQLKAMGIKSDDTVLIHTSYKSIGEVEGGIDGLIDAFKEYLSDGLFIVPTHTWAVVTRENPTYDVKSTVPCIGAVSAVAAFREDGVRSLHPTHSVWATGKNAKTFTQGEEHAQTPAPIGGCWCRLAELGAKILLIGVGNNRNTFIHAVDEMAKLDDRLAPMPWDITVIDHNGRKITHPYRNHYETGSENFGNFEKMFIKRGVQTKGMLGNAEVKICDAKKCTEVLLELYSKVKGNLCREEGEVPGYLYMKKAIVIGCPGSGKTTFSEKLQRLTDLPLFYLDAIWHKPDRTHISREEFDERLSEIFGSDEWIIDGNYNRTIEERIRKSDTVFLFDLPTDVCINGAIERLGKKRNDVPWVDEELSHEFKTEIEEFPDKHLQKIYELLDKYKEYKQIVIFKSRKQADEFLAEMERDI